MMSDAGRIIFVPKKQGTLATYTFDFTSSLGATETISTQVTTASVWTGVDAAPSALISGAASASGSKVNQNLTGGVVGVIYTLVCSITTSLSQTLKQSAYLTIVSDVP